MILDLGIIRYEDALKLQREFVIKRKLNEVSDSVIIAQHPAVFTIGRKGSRRNLLVSEEILNKENINILEVDRGGDITFHGPGQLVIYPIIDLRNRKKDLHNYLRDLEEVIIRFLDGYGIEGTRIKGATGVWVNDAKIAFIGIAAKDWITYHGLSININNDLKFFSMINPCGLKNINVTSLKNILGEAVSMQEVKDIFIEEFKHIFATTETEIIDEYSRTMA